MTRTAQAVPVALLALLLLAGTTSGSVATAALENFDFRVTERNDVYWKFSWKVEVVGVERGKRCQIEVEYLDADEFVVDDGVEYIDIRSDREAVRSYDLLDVEVARQVASASASLSCR